MKDIPTPKRIIEIKRNRRKKRVRMAILILILVLSVVGALSYFSSDSTVTINNISITGNSIVDAKKVNEIVHEDISGKYFGLFARSNFIIYPKNKIYKDVIKNFTRIKSLSVKLEGIHTIHLSIEERAGSYLYCGVSVPESKDQIGENCYFINNDGYIFDKAPYFSGNVYIKFYLDLNNKNQDPLGSHVFDVDKFHKIIRFIDGVGNLGFKPSYLVISSDGTYSMYLEPKNDTSNPKIIFKEDNDLDVILDNFTIAMSKSEFANEINSKYDTLSYIDLRFKNKVLYKFE